jgi:crotonobetainyl-CoA:carnitine CoA-transferase CaiB-like acyl-CoA transferase
MFRMHKPLEGIRVLEWGIFQAGPSATAILCDMGAEVIKIEQPGTGDPTRQALQYKGIDFKLSGGSNIFFEGCNRGKKSLTLNLAHHKGKIIIHNLIKKTDIFFTNIRRSTVNKMHMDYSSLSPINPMLIYASVSGFGKKGPDADRGSFDFQGQGRSGFMFSMGEPSMPPLLAQFGIIDQATAIMASYQMVIALLMRERLGVGQEVDVSLLSTASYLMYTNNLINLLTDNKIPRHEQASADPLRNYYQCQDGKWLILTQRQIREEDWHMVCWFLGCPELEHVPRFCTRDNRMENSKELVSIFNKIFAGKPRDEWLRLANESKLVICAVNTTPDAINDPQMIENNYIVDFDHPDMGKIRIPGFPIHFSEAQVNNNLIAPKLGEHTYDVLKEIGGYSDEEIARFRKDKVI